MVQVMGVFAKYTATAQMQYLSNHGSEMTDNAFVHVFSSFLSPIWHISQHPDCNLATGQVHTHDITD